MLLDIKRPQASLSSVAKRSASQEAQNPDIVEIANLLPDYGIGDRVHDLYVNKVMAALPGNESRMFGTGPSFRSIFFPNWQPAQALSFVTTDTELNDDWWRDFSVAALCQCMNAVASEIRKQLVTDKINNKVNDCNREIAARSATLYSRILGAEYTPLVNILNRINRATAKGEYRSFLIANVQTRQLWWANGLWKTPAWEMFNHYAKFMVLGASPEEVDSLIGELSALGLPIPGEVNRDSWRSYAEEFRNKPNVTGDDLVSAASDAIRKTTYIPTGTGMPASLPEGNSYEFTANSQPGNPYRQSRSSSCFTGDTLILMADGTVKEIATLSRGASVRTREGAATVANVSTPLRGDRALFRIDGIGPTFARTHPFVNGAPASEARPALLCLAPQQLRWAVPTLNQDGIGLLQAGSDVLTWPMDGSNRAIPHRVGSVVEAPGPPGPFLYNVTLSTLSGGPHEMIVGTDGRFFVAAEEFPSLTRGAEAAPCAVALMQGLIERGLPGYRPGDMAWCDALVAHLDQYGSSMCCEALCSALKSVERPPAGGAAPEALPARIEALFGALDGPGRDDILKAGFAAVFDKVLQSVGDWSASLIAMGWRDLRTESGDVLALTLFDLALSPATPLPADGSVRLVIEASVPGGQQARKVIWDRSGRTNTRFHHYFDQTLYFDATALTGDATVRVLACIDPSHVPALTGTTTVSALLQQPRCHDIPMVDPRDEIVGYLSYDLRPTTRDGASSELARSADWTPQAAARYAETLGSAMAGQLWQGLEAWSSARAAPRG